MAVEIPADRPPIDPYPLSPYVAWAGRRNRDPILEQFRTLFPASGEVLELASGSGAHVNYFAPHFKEHRFQPSDYDVDVFETIKKTRSESANENVADPVKIDLTDSTTWPDGKDKLYDVIFVINLFQVAPVSIIDGIAQVAARVLKPTGFLSIYGPFKVDAKYTTDSNQAFDQEILAAKVPEWGLKDVRDLETAANAHGILLKQQIDMPANNFILVFGKP
jgi:SAM-dependent methyltransferase